MNIKENGEDLIKKNYYYLIGQDNFLLSSNTNTEKSYKIFLENFKFLLDTYAHLKNISGQLGNSWFPKIKLY